MPSTPNHQRIDLAPGAAGHPLANLFDPRHRSAAGFERLLKKNPLVRRMFERSVGGKVVFDGRNDGKLTIKRRAHTLPPLAGFSPLANTALGMLAGMEKSILGQAFGLAALGQVAKTAPDKDGHMANVSNILNDPALTMEDKITFMLMAIMKKMDKEIETKGKEIESLQNKKQSGGKGGKGGGVFGAVGGMLGIGGQQSQSGSSKSIDVETMKLKRMIDKRSQMFDMLRQIIDKYNQTAKGIIDSIAR